MLRLELSQIAPQEAYQLLYEALEGRRLSLVGKIQALNWQLRQTTGNHRGRPRKTAEFTPKTPKKRRLSPQARKNIIAAQKKRWKAWKTRKSGAKAAKRSEIPK